MNTWLVLHTAASWALFGLIWLVQVVHYPLFAQVGAKTFRSFHERHTRRITLIVAPLMLAEAATAAVLLLSGFHDRWFLASLPLLVLNWGSTFFVQVPLHGRLSGGFDPVAHRRLVQTNWVRTLAWSARAVLLALAGFQ